MARLSSHGDDSPSPFLAALRAVIDQTLGDRLPRFARLGEAVEEHEPRRVVGSRLVGGEVPIPGTVSTQVAVQSGFNLGS